MIFFFIFNKQILIFKKLIKTNQVSLNRWSLRIYEIVFLDFCDYIF